MFGPNARNAAISLILFVGVSCGCTKPEANLSGQSAQTAGGADQTRTAADSPAATPDPELVSLTGLSDRIRRHKGKLVFLDLWALW